MQLLESIKVTTSITFRRAIIQVQLYNWELKQRRFWATHVNRKWAFSLFICLDAKKFVLLSFFSIIKAIYPRISTKPLPNDAKSPLPVDVRLSKTLLLKPPNKPLRQRDRAVRRSDFQASSSSSPALTASRRVHWIKAVPSSNPRLLL